MFMPRASFPYPLRNPSWFAGHMSRSLRELPKLLDDIELVIEARDARLPLTSINNAFDQVLTRWVSKGEGRGVDRQRIIVYTKKDLAEKRFEEPLIKAFQKHANQKVMFADTTNDKDVQRVLRHAVGIAEAHRTTLVTLRILVVGMPNVGKSSLLNALRRVGTGKGKAFRTGAIAGVTKRLTGTVKIHEDPPVYVYDTPGVMVPFLGKGDEGGERGMKLALTSGIKESLFELDAVADFLLWKMNRRLVAEPDLPSYLTTLPLPPTFQPTDALEDLVLALSDRLAAKVKGGEPDREAVMAWLLRHFREGKMGEWTLDDLVEWKASKRDTKEVVGASGAVEAEGEADGAKVEDIAEEEEVPKGIEAVVGEAVPGHPPSAPPRSSASPRILSLEDQVSLTVSRYLTSLDPTAYPPTTPSSISPTYSPPSSTDLASDPLGGYASASQQRKALKNQRLMARDEKLRAKGYDIKQRQEWQPGGVVNLSGGKKSRKGSSGGGGGGGGRGLGGMNSGNNGGSGSVSGGGGGGGKVVRSGGDWRNGAGKAPSGDRPPWKAGRAWRR